MKSENMKSKAFVLASDKIIAFLNLKPNKLEQYILKRSAKKLQKILKDERGVE